MKTCEIYRVEFRTVYETPKKIKLSILPLSGHYLALFNRKYGQSRLSSVYAKGSLYIYEPMTSLVMARVFFLFGLVFFLSPLLPALGSKKMKISNWYF